MSKFTKFDLIVVGAGSGGIGAACSAARAGLSVLLLEKSNTLGGNAVRGGVHVWANGAGGTGLPFEIYLRLRQIPRAVGISRLFRHISDPVRENGAPPFPGGELLIDPALTYLDSLIRCGSPGGQAHYDYVRSKWREVPFEPDAYIRVVREMLDETGGCKVLLNSAFVAVEQTGRHIDALVLANGERISAPFYVDSTADALLAQAAGAETIMGQESHSMYGETLAPAKSTNLVNATSLIYRITPSDTDAVEPASGDLPRTCWWANSYPCACITQYPGGDLNVNMLPTMLGAEVIELGYAAAYAECRRRVLSHWLHIQTSNPEFQSYRLKWIAPGLGVRESRRIVGRYVLTEHDLRAGLSGQNHPDIVAITDHSIDVHGGNRHLTHEQRELQEPYGVPFRCLLPREIDNLMVACRGASFSSIAASSCRLSRTMMQLGQAAGVATHVALSHGKMLMDVPMDEIRNRLAAQHVELEWPRPSLLSSFIRSEEAKLSTLQPC